MNSRQVVQLESSRLLREAQTRGTYCTTAWLYIDPSIMWFRQVYTVQYTVHFLLEEFRISLKSSLSTQSVCHIVSPRVGFGVWFWACSWSPGFYRTGVVVQSTKFSNPGVGVPQKIRTTHHRFSVKISFMQLMYLFSLLVLVYIHFKKETVELTIQRTAALTSPLLQVRCGYLTV